MSEASISFTASVALLLALILFQTSSPTTSRAIATTTASGQFDLNHTSLLLLCRDGPSESRCMTGA